MMAALSPPSPCAHERDLSVDRIRQVLFAVVWQKGLSDADGRLGRTIPNSRSIRAQ